MDLIDPRRNPATRYWSIWQFSNHGFTTANRLFWKSFLLPLLLVEHNGVCEFNVRCTTQICYFRNISSLVACMHTSSVSSLQPSRVSGHSGMGRERVAGQYHHWLVSYNIQAYVGHWIINIGYLFQIFFLLYQLVLYRHLCLFLCVGCSNFCVRQKPEPRQRLGIPSTTLATDPTISSWFAVLNNSHVSYVVHGFNFLIRFSKKTFFSAFIVTIVYWVLLSSPLTFSTTFLGMTKITKYSGPSSF